MVACMAFGRRDGRPKPACLVRRSAGQWRRAEAGLCEHPLLETEGDMDFSELVVFWLLDTETSN